MYHTWYNPASFNQILQAITYRMQYAVSCVLLITYVESWVTNMLFLKNFLCYVLASLLQHSEDTVCCVPVMSILIICGVLTVTVFIVKKVFWDKTQHSLNPFLASYSGANRPLETDKDARNAVIKKSNMMFSFDLLNVKYISYVT